MTLTLLFITCFLYNGILFLPSEIVVQPEPDQPDHLLWPWYLPLQRYYSLQELITYSMALYKP